MKRRQLSPNTKVTIIYDQDIGFVEEPALFVGYRRIMVGDVGHEIPVFEYKDREITGLSCFWVMPHQVQTQEHLRKMQREIIRLQVMASQIGREEGYKIPRKIRDPEIKQMAKNNADQTKAVVQKLGYDPRDEAWIEEELATTTREKRWFKFERENGVVFSSKWGDIVQVYNQQFKDDLSVEDAKNLHKKRTRYLIGSSHIRYSGNADKKQWVREARKFEEYHRECAHRMLDWTLAHQNQFPLVRTKKPIPFNCGPYFNECIERVPHLFAEASCNRVKEGIVLRVLSYDEETQYIRVDFTDDIRKEIVGEETIAPWIKDEHDYSIEIRPDMIETHLEILESLE